MRKNKITSILLSLAIAFGLWLYVVTNVSQEAEYTIYNVPVVMEGEALLNEKNLMITAVSADDVDLTLSGSRSDLAKVNNSNMVLKVNLGEISEPQEKKGLEYTPVYPGDVATNALTIENRHPARIYVTVEARRNKEVPVEVIWIGSTPEGFMSDRENRILDYDKVTAMPLTIRTRKRGDRIAVYKDGRERKLKDFLIDAKIPVTKRGQIPLLCHEDKVIAVIGYRIAEPYKREKETKRGLVIRYGESV